MKRAAVTDISGIGGDAIPAPRQAWPTLGAAGSRWRDIATRAFVSLWFLFQATSLVFGFLASIREAGGLHLDGLTAVHLVSRVCLFFFFTLIACLTLVRSRPVAQAPGLMPRFCALLGAFLLYLLPFLPEANLGLGWELTSAGLLAVGSFFTCIVMLRLGRSFSVMSEARQLVVAGPYAYIRHPLYLAEQLSLTGALIHYASLPAALLYVAQVAFQVQRMRNEEAVLLRSFPDYAAYMARTARLIPGVW
jgi:protein-S-isoprenylcysteine O-methyltransferase Ste14